MLLDKPRMDFTRAECIRLQCIECMGGTSSYVKECVNQGCSLWSFRLGAGRTEVTEVPIHILKDILKRRKKIV